MNYKLKYPIASVFFLLPCTIAIAQSSAPTVKTSNEHQVSSDLITLEEAIKHYGFPEKTLNADGTVDYAAYKKAKEKWVRENPGLHKRITTSQPAKEKPVSPSQSPLIKAYENKNLNHTK